jgi:crotonobetainyl-CoA:carnitine CoA-transferase CaiB-like acyl-CoA transferase
MFGVIGILAALERRRRTGRGGEVRCSLYETTAFLVGQHMAQQAVTGQPAPPMPVRVSAWAIYDVFETCNKNEQLFVGVVSDGQWKSFTKAFDLGEVGSNTAYAQNNQRVLARDVILPAVRSLFVGMTRAELVKKLDVLGLPFAPIARPDELFDDPHLNAAGGLLDISLPDGSLTRLPALPLELDGSRFAIRRNVPGAGDNANEILDAIGLTQEEIATLREHAIVG